MAAKKAKKKATTRRSRQGSARSGTRAAWKNAEVKLARYFGVERVGLGQKGHDLSEAPEVKAWLRSTAPDLLDEGALEPWTHICADSKCDKNLLTTLERWHEHVHQNPDKDFLKPLGIMGAGVALDDGPGPYVIGCCKLEDLPLVYRAVLAPMWNTKTTLLQVFHRFHIWRYPKQPVSFLLKAFEQVEQASVDWVAAHSKAHWDYKVRPLPLVYGSYPKRITAALFFKFPMRGGLWSDE